MTIHMHFQEHPPPHVHVQWPRGRAKVSFLGEVIEGTLPFGRRRRQVVQWIRANSEDLQEKWQRAERGEAI